ncbi:DUF5682 family protein [Brachyspira catarrhinii]|uniref:4-aminobutyrate aminotransferase n=1 Tax=Brachyspira catarrhinii TaxID=2528966 RepID=A0ABY2TSX5_9SPIR|nr:DUF5682 family protein [Brachyspira catarrhinii]TKZ35972.1 hypothetical protein EZH24_02520 [Brachyspira catarrhinii]
MPKQNENLKDSFDNDFEISFNENQNNIKFFPVRHHSPACAYHLKKIIEDYKPENILIEGPSDANSLMEYMIDENTTPPFCIYSSYIDKSKEKCRSYYPFLDYSPEFVAIKKSHELKINCSFIDMPFGSIIENSENNINKKPISIYDEDNNKFNVNDYTSRLTKKSGLKSFAEFWERDFEIKGILKNSEDFIKSVFALGYYMRFIESEDIETKNREYFMAKNIKEFIDKKANGILVITGSFHVKGIIDKLKDSENIEKEFNKLKKYNIQNSSNYLIPYSFEEADQRKGYIAGIEYPAFYNNIWKKLNEDLIENAYTETVKNFIIKAAGINRDYYNINIPDCINAYYMAINLAKLRGKNNAGVYELIDAVKSAFVKGEISLENTGNIELMMKLLSGIANGKVSSKSIVPPVVLDFRNLCKTHRIRIDKTETTESILDIIKDKNHFEKSKFFHKMRFLDIDFCKLIKGPDYIEKIDKNLAREIWKYKYNSQVEALLIDKSVYGTSVEELCLNFIKDKLKSKLNAEEISKLIIESTVMGLYNFLIDNYNEIENIILSDNDFISLCKALDNFSYLINIEKINGNINKERENIFSNVDIISKIKSLSKLGFILATQNMESIKNLDEESALKYSIYIKNLFIYTLENDDLDCKEIFYGSIDSMIQNTFGSSHIFAVCLSIKYKSGKIDAKEFASIISNFLETAETESIAYFLNGIFFIARDILFINNDLINEIDEAIKNIEENKFIEILPNLRFAFTNLTPTETERLSLIIAKLYQTKESNTENISEEEIQKAIIIDKKIAEEMNKYEIFR